MPPAEAPEADRNGGSADTGTEITTLEQMLDRMEAAAEEEERVSIGRMLDVVGRRSFGPILLVAGLITIAPVVGDIPGVPTMVAVIVFLTGVQLLLHRDHFWLPQWLLRRSISSEKLCKALGWLRRPAGFIDRILRHRLTRLTEGAMVYVIAVVCVLIAAAMPAMEVVPFSANGAGAALTAFGLSLIANDGLVAAFAFVFTAGTLGIVGYNLL